MAPDAGPLRDPVYRARVRALPCLLAVTGKCLGAVEAHHAGERDAKGRKPGDDTCVPLCHRHHVAEWHGASGHFKSWSRERRRAWAREAIQRTREDLAVREAVRVAEGVF